MSLRRFLQSLFPDSVLTESFIPIIHGHRAKFGALNVEVKALAGAVPKDPRLALPGPADFSLPLALSFPRDGSLLIFEADNTAVVHNMDPPTVFPYKPPQMRKIFEAFAAMLERRAAMGRERAA